MGIPGMGKTTLAETDTINAIGAGHAVVVLDPVGSLVRSIVWRTIEETNRANDIVLIDAADPEYRPRLPVAGHVSLSDEDAYEREVEQLSHILESNWGPEATQFEAWGAQMGQFIRNLAHILVASPTCTLADIPDITALSDLREEHLRFVRNRHVHSFWHNQYDHWNGNLRAQRVQSTLNKIDAFLTNEVTRRYAEAQGEAIDWDRLLAEHKIILVSLPKRKLQEPAVKLLGSVVLAQLRSAIFARTPARSPSDLVKVVIDEAELFQTPDIHELIEQGRQYGVTMTLMAHNLREFSDRNRAALLMAPTFAMGRVSPEDAPMLARKYDNKPLPGRERFEPLRVPSEQHPGTWVQASEWYGTGRYAQRVNLSVPVDGNEISTTEVRNRTENDLINLPFFEFMGHIANGSGMQKLHFRGIDTPCPLTRAMPEWVQAEYRAIRRRCREDFYVKRTSSLGEPIPTKKLWDEPKPQQEQTKPEVQQPNLDRTPKRRQT